MGYKSETISTAIGRLNTRYFLPAIQREFVWKPEQIVQLFDSILRGYPISSFLFWEIKPENRDKWQAYRFIDAARQGGTHNTAATTDGVSSPTLVLDGQQRLTSLLIGLKGTYEIKKKWKRWDNPDAWTRARLHVDLLHDAYEGDGEPNESSTYYRMAFFDQAPEPSDDDRWFRLGRILDFDDRRKFDEFMESEEDRLPESVTKGRMKVFRRNLERLYRAVWEEDVIAYYTEIDQDYDRVLDIFVRANDGGTKLTKSDLLLSMVTSSWDDMNAREEIYSFVDRLNTELTRHNDLDKDFIMKACLVLADLPVAYQVKNFNQPNLVRIRERWGQIKKAVERGVDLANSFGIDRDNLVSANALIPVIYYICKNPDVTFRGSTAFEVRNAQRLRCWLVGALLNGAFGGSSDTTLRDIRSCLSELGAGQDFPADEVNAAIRKSGRLATIDTDSVEDALDLTWGRRETFLALSLLYDEAGWGTMSYHEDHLFARSLFKTNDLTSQGLSSGLTTRDRLGNLCLLLAHENQGKSDMPLHEWLASRDRSFRDRHLIPEDPELWRFECFAEFLKAREQLIRARLMARYAS